MSTDSDDLAGQVARARAGDEAAYRDLLQRFEPEVRMVVRGKLPRALRSQFDSMDFVQAVWQSVFTGDNADLGRFENSRHLLGYLAGVARNKVYEEHRRLTRTRKYDVGREESLYVRKGNREVPRDLAASDTTPSQVVQGRDTLAKMMEGLGARDREVIDLRRKGLKYEEIAGRLGMHEAAVRRVVEAVRRRMEDR